MRDSIKHWASLEYHDPAEVLRKLPATELDIPAADLGSRVARLRTNQLKRFREARDAALFTYGLGVAHGSPVYYVTEEQDDYDFVACWADDGVQHFTPVQLKEWVAADLDSTATLQDLLGEVATSAVPAGTVLAVRLNRRAQVDLDKLDLPKLPWAELWFFWAASSDQNRWSIGGDALTTPSRIDFEYPT